MVRMRGLAAMLLLGLVLTACGRASAGTGLSSPSAETRLASTPAAAPAGPGKGQPPAVTDFPQAPQSLILAGDLNANVTSGRPQSCGFGSGSDNFTVFSLAVFFQVGPTWYRFGADTDYASGPYHGPGTYTAAGSLWPVGASGPSYNGRLQLVVRRDQTPDAGTVEGTMTDGPRQVTITGGWTGSPGPELGPA